jgi:hypothetical protein
LRSRRRRKKSNNRIFLVIGLAFMLAVLWVWKSIEAHNMARQLSSLETEKKQILESNKLLKAERERLCSIGCIDTRARAYGMSYEVKSRMVLFDMPVKIHREDKNIFVSVGDYLAKLAEQLTE